MRFLLVCGAVLAAGVALWLLRVDRAALPPGKSPGGTGAAVRGGTGKPVEFRSKHPRGSRIPMRLPPATSGISIGAGVFVPPLNGVRVRDGIPPIKRARRLPPPGPVVAKLVDGQGQEWWLHEDGSQTSCSFASVTLADGTTKVIVSTQHGAAAAGSHGVLRAR